MTRKPTIPRDQAATEQLEALLRKFPDHGTDVEGVLLDYLGRTGGTLKSALDLNPNLYLYLFGSEDRSAGKRVLAALVGDSQENPPAALEEKYPRAAALVREVSDAQRAQSSKQSETLLGNPRTGLGYKVRSVIWQLSDIHFGKYNQINNDPHELAYQLGRITNTHEAIGPDVIIVSGDVSSIADRNEFRHFCQFARKLQELLWGEVRPGRFLVIPGNHDVVWKDTGKADRMKRFVAQVAMEGCCVTPFGVEGEELEGGSIIVKRIISRDNKVPPIAVVRLRDLDLEVQLVITGFYSGEIPPKFREIVGTLKGTHDELLQLLRVDHGAINQAYLHLLEKVPKPEASLRLAVVHHNPIPYGLEVALNPQAPQLMRILCNQGAPLVLHGHVHLIEDFGGAPRPIRASESYPIPCPTLCSVPWSGGRGLAVHLVGNESESQTVDSIVWPLSASGQFESTNATLRYRFLISEGRLSLRLPPSV